MQFKLWEIKDKKGELKIDLDFKNIIEHKRLTEDKLTSKEKIQILIMSKILKENVFNPRR